MQKGIRFVTSTGILFALVLVVQVLGLPQMVTGPLVNAMLLLATVFVGMASGVLIGLFTPWVALLRGILPAPLGPMVPFIMLGNAALVVVFGLFRRKEGLLPEVTGMVLGAFVKYLVLSQAVRFLVTLPPRVAQMMQIPQLITALLGGAVALLLSRALRRIRFGE
ncbi:MAG: ECF transporter S component [Atribacterota bacterium]